MATTMRIEHGGQCYELSTEPRPGGLGRDEARLPHDDALRVLRWLDPEVLRQLAPASGRVGDRGHRDAAREELLDDLWRGRLVVRRIQRPRPTVSVVYDDRLLDRVGENGEPLLKSTWVEIELVDEDGAPMSNLPYELVLPDGSLRMGVLDADGRARVRGIADGVCEVDFPDLASDEWRAA